MVLGTVKYLRNIKRFLNLSLSTNIDPDSMTKKLVDIKCYLRFGLLLKRSNTSVISAVSDYLGVYLASTLLYASLVPVVIRFQGEPSSKTNVKRKKRGPIEI